MCKEKQRLLDYKYNILSSHMVLVDRAKHVNRNSTDIFLYVTYQYKYRLMFRCLQESFDPISAILFFTIRFDLCESLSFVPAGM